MIKGNNVKKLVITALCVALCTVLPFLFHTVPNGGSIFSPMHIPVLICGLLCGGHYGILCGIAGPLVSSLATSQPPPAYLPPMLLELAVYGLVSGLCMRFIRTKKYLLDMYISLACAMLVGRIAAGVAKAVIFTSPEGFTFKLFLESYFVTSLPGILIQLLLIPAIVAALMRAGVIGRKYTEDGFAKYIKEQYRLHPSMTARDVYKLCYQAVYGAEHLLCDGEAARVRFFEEFAAVESDAHLPLYEAISPEVCRINLGAWKAADMRGEWLFNMFAASVRVKRGSHDQFVSYVETARRVLPTVDFKKEKLPCGAVHHSDIYREREKPSYRIVDKRFIRLLPILQRISGDVHTVAFDGRAAAGKSTAAEDISVVLGITPIHMDDFFLPPDMRSEERLSQAGGNVHYERFESEVLPHLAGNEEFTYRIFDCGKMELCGERRIEKGDIRIVEGAYSLHGAFGDYADLKVFFDITPSLQMRRIRARNGEQMAEMFEKRWIPLEESYIKAFRIKEKADIVINARQ